jgi:hypothetical protein
VRIVGLVATGAVAFVAVVGVVVGVRSIADVKRYLRIRRM